MHRSAALVAAFALAAGACSSGSDDPGGAELLASVAGGEVLVMLEVRGGLAPEGTDELAAPVVTVYGDGRAYAPDLDGALHRLALDDESLLAVADDVAASAVSELPPDIERDADLVVLDAADTVFTLADGSGGTSRHRAAGLVADDTGYPAGVRFLDRELRALAADVVALGEPDDGVGVRVVAQGGFQTTDPAEAGAVRWPDDLLVPAELATLERGTVVVDITDDTAERYRALVGRVFTPVVLPDRTLLSIAARPLLPHEA